MTPLAPRLRFLSPLPHAAAARLRRLLLSAFSSSSRDNGGPGSEKTPPEDPGSSPSPTLEPRQKKKAKMKRAHLSLAQPDWQSSAVLASLTPTQAAIVATSHPDPVIALELLLFLSRKHYHKHLPGTFATLATRLVEARKYPAAVGRARIHMIKSCCTKAEMRRAMDDLDKLTSGGPRMGLLTYGALLIQLSSLGMTATLMDRYRRLLREGPKPNLLIYNTVINALCKDGNVIDAQLVMDKVSESGIKPDAFTYTSMILGYCKKSDLDSAFEVFVRMCKEGCEPNAATYSTLINGLCGSGRVNEALDLIREMTQRGVLPTAYAITPPIAALCDLGRTEDAWRLFVDMKKKGCVPNVYAYTSLISGQHVSRVAIGLFHRMVRDSVLPHTMTYNALINVLVEDRKMHSALIVCTVMRRHGCFPNTRTYNEMIKGYCTIGDMDKAMLILFNLLKRRPRVAPVTYKAIIKGYCDSGNASTALRILELMEPNGCEPDEWSYTELIRGFCEIRKMECASRLFNEMADRGLRANVVTYTTLISGYCKDEKLDRAAEMLEQMKASGCRPSIQTYNVLIHALTVQNNFSAAEKLCEVMLEENISPDVVTYSSMIDGLCKNGATSLALEMLNKMKEHNCLPNLHTYSSLIQALGQEGKVEEAEELFSDLLRQGHTPDEVAYVKMIEVYIMSGKVDHAFNLLGKMINAGCLPTLRTYDVLIKGLQNEYLMVEQKLVALPDAVSNCCFDDQAINKYAISILSSKLGELDVGLSRQLPDTFLSGLSRSGRWFEADHLYRSMVGQGLCPNQEAYNYFISSLLRAQKVDLAMGVYRHMSAQCRELQLVGYKALICTLCQFHRMNEARFIFEDMLSKTFDPDNIAWTVLINGLLEAGYKDMFMEFLHIMEKNHSSFIASLAVTYTPTSISKVWCTKVAWSLIAIGKLCHIFHQDSEMYICVSELGSGNNWMNFIRTVMLCVLVFVCSFTLQPISVGILSGTHLAPQIATVSMVLEALVLPLFHPLILEMVMPALRGTLYSYNLPDATNLAAAVLVFLILTYFHGFCVVLPVRSKNAHGQQSSYPINLLCMSNMPITGLYFVSKLLYRNYSEIFVVNLLGKGMDQSNVAILFSVVFMLPVCTLKDIY